MIYPLSRRGGRSKNVLADRSLNSHPRSEMFRSKRCPVSPCLTSMCLTISRPDRPRKRRRNTEIATVRHPRRSMVVFPRVQLLCVQPFLRPDRPENCVTTTKKEGIEMATWKHAERQDAKWLNGRRVPVSGRVEHVVRVVQKKRNRRYDGHPPSRWEKAENIGVKKRCVPRR